MSAEKARHHVAAGLALPPSFSKAIHPCRTIADSGWNDFTYLAEDELENPAFFKLHRFAAGLVTLCWLFDYATIKFPPHSTIGNQHRSPGNLQINVLNRLLKSVQFLEKGASYTTREKSGFSYDDLQKVRIKLTRRMRLLFDNMRLAQDVLYGAIMQYIKSFKYVKLDGCLLTLTVSDGGDRLAMDHHYIDIELEDTPIPTVPCFWEYGEWEIYFHKIHFESIRNVKALNLNKIVEGYKARRMANAERFRQCAESKKRANNQVVRPRKKKMRLTKVSPATRSGNDTDSDDELFK